MTDEETAELELDLLDMRERLHRILAVPPINADAASRRERVVADSLREIERLQASLDEASA